MKIKRVPELNAQDVRVIQAVKDAQSEHFVIDTLQLPALLCSPGRTLQRRRSGGGRGLAEALECHPGIFSLNQLGNLQNKKE